MPESMDVAQDRTPEQIEQEEAERAARENEIYGPYPVSYTHLDVYKRQPGMRSRRPLAKPLRLRLRARLTS